MAKGKKKTGTKGNNRAEIVIYRGPIKAPGNDPQFSRTALKQYSAISSNSAGFVESYNSTGNVTSMPEWSSLAALWREYRVLGIRMQWIPVYNMSGSTVSSVPGAAAIYHGPAPAWQGAVTSSSVQSTFQMDGGIPWHCCQGITLEWRMSDIEEAQFLSTSASGTFGGYYAVSGNTSTSRVVAGQYVTYLVEFKGRV